MRRVATATSAHFTSGGRGRLLLALLALGLGTSWSVTAAPAGADVDPCPNAAIRAIQQLSQLPDCRAAEQVSPVDKNGFNATTKGFDVAVDGNGFGYQSGPSQAFAGATNNTVGIYRATRGVTGWSTSFLTPPTTFPFPSSLNGFDSLNDFSGDLSKAFITSADSLDPADTHRTGNSNFTIYRLNTDGSATWMGRGAANGSPGGQSYQGMSASGSYVAFIGSDSLDPAHPLPPGAGNALYVSDGATPRLASILPSGGVDPQGAALGNEQTSGNGFATNALAPEGQRVAFTGVDSADGITTTQLYLRNTASEQTVLVSKSPGGEAATQPVLYEGAVWGSSLNEGKLYFSTGSDLLGGHPGGGLYAYDIKNETVSFVAPAAFNSQAINCEVAYPNICSGVVGISDDGSRIYFTSSKVLAPSAEAGKTNLYLYEVAGSEVSLVATLQNTPRDDVASDGAAQASILQNFTTTPGLQLAQLTQGSGQFLVFESRSQLTAFESGGSSEIYRYDAGSGHLDCASCGAEPVPGNSWLNLPFETSLNPLTITGSLRLMPRYISADGSRVFFNSSQAIVPDDANGRVDAYEWHDGKISLLSRGITNAGSYFLGASAEGRDVFIDTLDRLTLSDTDNLYDIYDLREGGGFPEHPPALGCSGEGCRGAAPAPPGEPSFGSTEFSAPPQPRAKRQVKKKHPRKHHRGGRSAHGKSHSKSHAKGRGGSK